MYASSPADWEGLFLAGAGASAALAGLLFVAVSINLTRILEVSGRPGRAGEAIVLLVAVLDAWVLLIEILRCGQARSGSAEIESPG